MTSQAAGDSLREMVAGVREGEPAAYEALFRTLGPAALRVAGKMVYDRGHAEDIVQETFVTVFQKIGTLEKDAAFRSWFFSVLVNRCREHLRRGGSGLVLAPGSSRVEVPQAGEGGAAEFAKAAEEAAAKLPPLERELYERVIHGHATYDEVARAHGVTSEVIRTRVYRLRKKLRELWLRIRRAEG